MLNLSLCFRLNFKIIVTLVRVVHRYYFILSFSSYPSRLSFHILYYTYEGTRNRQRVNICNSYSMFQKDNVICVTQQCVVVIVAAVKMISFSVLSVQSAIPKYIRIVCFLRYCYTERKLYLGQRKFVLVSQPKRIFLCNKEKYIQFKCLLLYFKDPHLKSKDPVL